MTALTVVREVVFDALKAGVTSAPVYDQPLENMPTPVVVLVPGSPWVTNRGGVALEIVTRTNAAAGNTNALTAMETLIGEVREALFTAGLAPGDTDTPTPTEDGNLTAVTYIRIRATIR